jgi:hypothetical protein
VTPGSDIDALRGKCARKGDIAVLVDDVEGGENSLNGAFFVGLEGD